MDLGVLKSAHQLVQSRPADTNAASILAKADGSQIVITNVVICNTSNAAATASMFLDIDGTTYSQATAIMYAAPIAANTVELVEFVAGLPFDKTQAGNFAVQVGTANAITFTVNGIKF